VAKRGDTMSPLTEVCVSRLQEDDGSGYSLSTSHRITQSELCIAAAAAAASFNSALLPTWPSPTLSPRGRTPIRCADEKTENRRRKETFWTQGCPQRYALE
jgi:hypothetical protein